MTPEGVRRASVPMHLCYGAHTHTHKLSLNSIQNVQMQVQRCDSMLTGTYRVHIPTGLFTIYNCYSLGAFTEEHKRTPGVSTWMEILRGNNQVCVSNPAPVGPQPL